MSEVERLRDALEQFGVHASDCVAGQFRAGRPTKDGGYESLFGYGKNEKWYQKDEAPPCTCGLSEALAAEPKVCKWTPVFDYTEGKRIKYYVAACDGRHHYRGWSCNKEGVDIHDDILCDCGNKIEVVE
jgi:hypothetical protein